MNRFDGQTILITGGTKGIGRAAAFAFAKAGANVSIVARTASDVNAVSREISAMGVKAIGIIGDAAEYASIKNAVAKTADAFDSIDIVFANAGAIFQRTSVADSDPELWRKCVESSLFGTYNTVYAALPFLKRNPNGGKIFTIGSGRGRRAGGLADYACAKAGVWMLARNLALELAPDNILVNEILPGPVLTQMNNEQSSAPHGVEYYKPPECVAELLLYAASFDNRTGPTGQTFSLNRREL